MVRENFGDNPVDLPSGIAARAYRALVAQLQEEIRNAYAEVTAHLDLSQKMATRKEGVPEDTARAHAEARTALVAVLDRIEDRADLAMQKVAASYAASDDLALLPNLEAEVRQRAVDGKRRLAVLLADHRPQPPPFTPEDLGDLPAASETPREPTPSGPNAPTRHFIEWSDPATVAAAILSDPRVVERPPGPAADGAQATASRSMEISQLSDIELQLLVEALEEVYPALCERREVERAFVSVSTSNAAELVFELNARVLRTTHLFSEIRTELQIIQGLSDQIAFLRKHMAQDPSTATATFVPLKIERLTRERDQTLGQLRSQVSGLFTKQRAAVRIEA